MKPEHQIGALVWPDPELAPESDEDRLMELLGWMREKLQRIEYLESKCRVLKSEIPFAEEERVLN